MVLAFLFVVVLAFLFVVVLIFFVMSVLVVVVTFMATLAQDVKFYAGWQGDTVVAFSLDVEVNEANAFFFGMVIFIVHHLEHHLNL